MIDSFWQTDIALADLSSWLEAAFAANLAYTLILGFGRFSGNTLCKWADSEKLRVIPPLAENDDFDEPKFSNDIDSLENFSIKIIRATNIFVGAWATVSAFFFICTPFL